MARLGKDPDDREPGARRSTLLSHDPLVNDRRREACVRAGADRRQPSFPRGDNYHPDKTVALATWLCRPRKWLSIAWLAVDAIGEIERGAAAAMTATATRHLH